MTLLPPAFISTATGYQLAPGGNAVIRQPDGATIPFSNDNVDYRYYLKWVDDGGVPDPAQQPAVAVDPRVPYHTLYLLLLESPAYSGFIQRASAPGAPTAMLAAQSVLQDAMAQARTFAPIIPQLQAALAGVLTVGGFTAPELASIQAILEAAGLDEVFELG